MNFNSSPQSDNGPVSQEVEKPQRAKSEKLYGHCFRVNTIKSGETISVGGSVLSDTPTNESHFELINDLELFDGFYKKTEDRLKGVNLEQLRELLDSADCEMSEKTFAELLAFTRSLAEEYPNASEGAENRQALYRNAKDGLKLTDAFKENGAACVEISALAQGFLQKRGVESALFSGEVLWKNDQEFPEEHTFITFKDKGKTYIYDPANPVRNGDRPLPSVFLPALPFEEEMRTDIKRFVTSTNVVTKMEAYYGVGNHTNIIPERDIV
jgi:hypothetical protein